MKAQLFLLAGFLSLCACADKNTAGTTSETENEIALRVNFPDGTPAAHTQVYLVDAGHFDSLLTLGKNPQIDSGTTDGNGQVVIHSAVQVATRNLLAQAPGYAALLQGLTGANVNATMNLSKAGSIQGHTNMPVGARIVLDASGLSTLVDSSGNYVFSNVPQGYYALFTSSLAQKSESFLGAITVKADTNAVQTDSQAGFLLDNFDAGRTRPLIAALGAGGPWYLYSELAGTHFGPAGVDSNITLAISAANAYQGRSLNVTIALDTNPVTPYGTLACKLGPDSGLGRVNLSSLDSISIWVKGSGQVRLFFASTYIHTNYPSSQAGADLGYTFTLPATWTRIVIPIDSLKPPPNTQPALDGVTWSMVASSIDLFGIGSWAKAGSVIQLQMDDIRLYGISPNTFR